MISNNEVFSFVSQYPERLVGVGSVDISRLMQAIAEIKRCVNELGFKAIRVLPWLWELPPTDRLFYPIYATCCELGISFCTQIGHTSPLMSSEVGRPIYIDRVAIDFPELVIVGGHIGYPWTEEAIAVATKHRNFYIDTSAYTIKRYPPEIIRYLKNNGKKSIIWIELSNDNARLCSRKSRRVRSGYRNSGALFKWKYKAGFWYLMSLISATIKMNKWQYFLFRFNLK